ncbi:isoprenoid synthase domain-containing protein [Mycena leptocephala]|nr:isoprenoid synthase domain-containing protein [Mycena leptocephala]
MDNLPQTFLFPPLKSIMAEFKPEGDHIHPLREEAKLETLKWVSRCGCEMNSDNKAYYMAAFMYPDVDFDDLVLAMEWLYWSFFIDDSLEDLVRMYEEVQKNRDIAERGPLPLIIEMFQAIWFKMRQKNRPRFESLFANASINYTRGLPELDKMRHDAGIPDLETHKRNRRLAIFVEAPLQLTGFILDLKVDQGILHSSQMKELNATYIELGWLINDIFSWNIEQSRNRDKGHGMPVDPTFNMLSWPYKAPLPLPTSRPYTDTARNDSEAQQRRAQRYELRERLQREQLGVLADLEAQRTLDRYAEAGLQRPWKNSTLFYAGVVYIILNHLSFEK